MKIILGADHAGFESKKLITEWLHKNNYETLDCGTNSKDSVDYPDFAHHVANGIIANKGEFGILICGTGNGVAMVANKHPNIRAGICWNVEVAKLTKAHNNANIICLPARFISFQEMIDIIKAFIETEFEGHRHLNRIKKINC